MAITLDPREYSTVPAYELLSAAACGHAGLDHRLLHALVDDPDRTLPDLLRFAARPPEDDRVPLEEDLTNLFRHLRRPEALPFFIERIRRDPYEIPDELVEAFALFPERSAELLLELYQELGEEEGSEIAFLLAAMRVRDERIAELLARRRESGREDADFCLELYNDQSPHGSPEHPAFDIWELYPVEAQPPFSILSEAERLEFLAGPSAEFRAAAAESFFNQELSANARERLLAAALEDRQAEVRARAWEALGDAVERPEVRTPMLAVLSDAEAPMEERCGALVGLAAEADDPAVRRWILDFYARPASRAKALEAMYRSFDRRFSTHFPPHLDDPDPEVRRQAIWGVGHLGIHTEVGRLRALFDNEEFRDEALFAYALAVPGEISRGRAQALLRKVEQDAGGLSRSEAEWVQWAIDERLARHGLEPVFEREDDEAEPPPAPMTAGRNDPCPCGSGKKFKKCCGV